MTEQLRDDEIERAPEVSVILATYNRPHLLREALASLLAQDGVAFEVIVVNDGGCDVSDVVAESSDLMNLQYVNQPQNGGLPAARNTGFARSRGRFITYLDDDDLYQPGHLRGLASRLDSNPEIGLVYSDVLLVRGRREGDGSCTIERRVLAHDYDRVTMLHDSFISPSAMMHQRVCFDRVGGFDEKLRWCYDDWDFLLRIDAHYVIQRVEGATVTVRLRDDGSNLSTTRRPERQAAAVHLNRQYGAADIQPKTFWEVAETLEGKDGNRRLSKIE
jgi:glycosyltransferase involved in cell wall biosynthesis